MFKWKVSSLGGSPKKTKQQKEEKLNNQTISQQPNKGGFFKDSKRNSGGKNNENEKNPELENGSEERSNNSKFKLFSMQSIHNNRNGQQPPLIANGKNLLRQSIDGDTLNRVGQRLADNDKIMAPPLVAPRPSYPSPPQHNVNNPRTEHNNDMANHWQQQYLQHQQAREIQQQQAQQQQKPPVVKPMTNYPANLEHWSSHGYLAKSTNTEVKTGPTAVSPPTTTASVPTQTSGEIVPRFNGVKRQREEEDHYVPLNFHKHNDNQSKKYFSFRGFPGQLNDEATAEEEAKKYHTLDARSKMTETTQGQNQQQFNSPYMRINRPVLQRSATYENGQAFFLNRPNAPASNTASNTNTEPVSNNNTQHGSLESWSEWTRQLQAYVAWVNSQLKKRPDLKPVQDLRRDLQSGEVLAQLIGIISGEEIPDIQYKPESLQGMKENLEKILLFMAQRQIRMHQITAKEILEGNLRAVMRLILALAAHYKPQSVRSSIPFDQMTKNSPQANGSATQPKQHEPNSLSPTTKNSYQSTSRVNPPQSSQDSTASMPVQKDTSVMESNLYSSLPTTTSFNNLNPENNNSDGRRSEERRPSLTSEDSFIRTGSGRKLPEIPTTKPKSNGPSIMKRETNTTDKEIKQENRKSKPKALEFWERMETVDNNSSSQDLRYHTIHRMTTSTSSNRRMLPKVPDNHVQRSQSLDRHGNLSAPLPASNYDEENVEQLSIHSCSSGCSASLPRSTVQTRTGAPLAMDEIPVTRPVLPSHPSPLSIDSRGEVEGSSDNNTSPSTSINGRGGLMNKRGLTGKEPMTWLRSSFNRTTTGSKSGSEVEAGNGSLPVANGFPALRSFSMTDGHPHNNVHSNSLQIDAQLKKLQPNFTDHKQVEKLYSNYEEVNGMTSKTRSRLDQNGGIKWPERASMKDLRLLYDEELAVAKDAITNLRTSFSESDPNQHILDTLEQCLSVIIEKIQRIDLKGEHQGNNMTNGSVHESEGIVRSSSQHPVSTKILYFTNRSVTPFMSSINKRIGEITLRDFKELFDRPGFYRFHFKSVDKEFGVVKEEIVSDDGILPGAEDKIVAWVEEDD